MKVSKNSHFRSIVSALCLIMVFCFAISPAAVAGAQSSNMDIDTDAGCQVATPTDLSTPRSYTEELSPEQLMRAKLSDADVPELLATEFASENGHVNRLRSLEQDLSTVTFQNRDGTNTTYLFSSPVKYVDSDGTIRDKSNSLTSTIEDSRFKNGYAYVNQGNDIKTYFPAKIRPEMGVALVGSDFVIGLSPMASSVVPSLSKDSDVSAQAVRASTAQKELVEDHASSRQKDAVVYKGVFGDNTSLRYSATFDGFKEDIILYNYSGQNRFSFQLTTNGLSLVRDEIGNLYLSDPLTDEYVASIGRLIILDSGSHASAPDPSANHYYEVETVKDNQVYTITVVVDEAFLTSPDTVYPVYIDPEITAFTGNTKNILDAPIYEYVNTSQGANYWNVVGQESTNYGIGRTLMRFPGLDNNSSYTKSSNEILSLKLYLYNNSTNTNAVKITACQYTGTGGWSESGVWANNVTWNSNGATYSEVPVSSNNRWYAFDLPTTSWRNNLTLRNKGIMLRNSDESNSSKNKSFSSTERSSEKPYLSFTYRRTDLMNANTILSYTSEQLSGLDSSTYNCYGNGIGKQVYKDPTGYHPSQSTAVVYAAVVNDLGGPNNVRQLSSINSSINSDEFRVAVKCGPRDYHFIRQLSNGDWYNKSGDRKGLVVSQDYVAGSVWYLKYMENGVEITNENALYNDETIYFAVKKNWFS